jgi:hypothetical protein
MDTERYRIIEWTSEFRNGSREVTYELQSQNREKKWYSLGVSATLAAARKALLFCTQHADCWLS